MKNNNDMFENKSVFKRIVAGETTSKDLDIVLAYIVSSFVGGVFLGILL